MYKQGKLLTSVWTYVGLVFMFTLLFASIQFAADDLQKKHNAGTIDLPTKTQEYILSVKNVNIDAINATKDEIQDPVAYEYNDSAGNPKDFAIEFLFSQEQASDARSYVQAVYSIPTTILKILGLPISEFQYIINAILWLFVVGVSLAIYFMIRGAR